LAGEHKYYNFIDGLVGVCDKLLQVALGDVFGDYVEIFFVLLEVLDWDNVRVV
jgi:hypothetical protein